MSGCNTNVDGPWVDNWRTTSQREKKDKQRTRGGIKESEQNTVKQRSKRREKDNRELPQERLLLATTSENLPTGCSDASDDDDVDDRLRRSIWVAESWEDLTHNVSAMGVRRVEVAMGMAMAMGMGEQG
jgi:hypothetical protein